MMLPSLEFSVFFSFLHCLLLAEWPNQFLSSEIAFPALLALIGFPRLTQGRVHRYFIPLPLYFQQSPLNGIYYPSRRPRHSQRSPLPPPPPPRPCSGLLHPPASTRAGPSSPTSTRGFAPSSSRPRRSGLIRSASTKDGAIIEGTALCTSVVANSVAGQVRRDSRHASQSCVTIMCHTFQPQPRLDRTTPCPAHLTPRS